MDVVLVVAEVLQEKLLCLEAVLPDTGFKIVVSTRQQGLPAMSQVQ